MNSYPLLMKYIESMCPITKESYEFRIGKTPVTVGIWKEFCRATRTDMPEEPWWGWVDDHPVVNVSWNEVMTEYGFFQWVNTVSGFNYTLPLDTEWEFVARSGQRWAYPWGGEFDRSKLWCSNDKRGDAKQTASVNRTSNIYENSYGVIDLSGNCKEWCITRMPLPNGTRFPYTRDDCRITKGGSWVNNREHNFTVKSRTIYDADTRSNEVGFRIISGQLLTG
jgi:formylglycine-generating enzyme required for sulfatase activity